MARRPPEDSDELPEEDPPPVERVDEIEELLPEDDPLDQPEEDRELVFVLEVRTTFRFVPCVLVRSVVNPRISLSPVTGINMGYPPSV